MSGVGSVEHDIKPDTRDGGVLQDYASSITVTEDVATFYADEPVSHEQQQDASGQLAQGSGSKHEQLPRQAHAYKHQNEHEPDQELPSSHREPSHSAITSTEELRIAAQLSQDLSQGLNGIASMLGESSHNSISDNDPSLRNVATQHDPQSLPHQVEHHDQQQQLGDNEREQPRQPNNIQLTSNLNNHDGHINRNDHNPVPLAEHVGPVDQPSIDHNEEPLRPSHEQPLQSPLLPNEDHALEQQSQYQQGQQQQRTELTHQQFIPNQERSQQYQPQPHQSLPLQHGQPLQHQRPYLQPHGGPNQLDPLVQEYATHTHQAVQDNILGARKRSKVSRACDECRRKKVKCDASCETDAAPCTNCRKASISCLFSRIPQKRGPSKGYIKELADRIHHIEGKLASEGNLEALNELLSGSRRDSSDIYSPSGEQDESSRKRPYSSISGADLGTPNTLRRGSWNSETRPVQPYQPPINGLKGVPYSSKGLAPQPLAKPDSHTPSQTASSSDETPMDLDNQAAPVKGLINDAFGVYLSVVHPCFPFLAGTKERVEAQLSQCPALLRDAFIEVFNGTMQSCVSAPGLYTTGDIGSATRMVAKWESSVSSRNSLENLVHLQTLIMMAIGTDNYGPPSLTGEHGGPSKASILGRAVGLAYSMRLHMASLAPTSEAHQDPESDENIAICTWWSLIMLDRWNAVSTANPLFIPNDSVVILPSLVSVLGENVYHLARMSRILGHFSLVSLAPPRAFASDTAAVPILNGFLDLSIELFREVLPENITPSTNPILHLVYWHSRLLAYLFQTNARSKDVIWACKEAAGLLFHHTALLSPLNHHFFCLIVLALLELAKLDDIREEAAPLLKDLLDRNLAPSTWDGTIRDRIADQLRPSTAQSTADQTLKHLAELATTSGTKTAESENDTEAVKLRTSTTYEDLGFDPRPILRMGYLNVLGGLPSASDPSE